MTGGQANLNEVYKNLNIDALTSQIQSKLAAMGSNSGSNPSTAGYFSPQLEGPNI